MVYSGLKVGREVGIRERGIEQERLEWALEVDTGVF